MEKKSFEESPFCMDGLFKRISRCMKLSVIFLFFFVTAVFADSAHSQEAKVNINANNIKMKELLREIEQQSEYLFIYNSNEIRMDDKVSLNAQNETVRNVLFTLFNRTDIVYAIEGNSIMLMKRPNPEQTQKKKVTGNIVDEKGEPIIGASISLKGTNTGTITDINGDFTIEVLPESVLLLSYIGYQTMEIRWDGQEALRLTMKENTELLDEVVVVGYATVKKANLTGAVSVVDDKVLKDRPIMNLGQGLQGTIPNLNVSTSGRPGDGSTYNIRGYTSINGGTPLVLVDGVEKDANLLNPQDIKSVSVLKDAASASIYGARAAYGVILITTKEGKKEQPTQVNLDTYLSINSPTTRPRYMDSWQYRKTIMNYL